MTVYNSECFLDEAIHSVLAQSLTDFELIIIDDGSTDKSPAILLNYSAKDNRIRLFTQSNSGIGAATGLAIRKSNGNYIAIMDSDDISEPDRLARQKEYLDTHPDVDAVGTQWQMCSPDNQDLGVDTLPLNNEIISTLMFAHQTLHHPTVMYRRKALEKVGGYNLERSCLVPDYDVFMKMRLAGLHFANLPYVLFTWRINPASTTRTKSIEQAKSVVKVRDEGFSELLQINPQQAKSIAHGIVNSFPTGTWQDERIKKLLPDQGESLLFRTWESLPAENEEEQFNRALILWLRKSRQDYANLRDQLVARQMPWFASLLESYVGVARPLVTAPFAFTNLSDQSAYELSLFIPFTGLNEDFNQRVEQAITLKNTVPFQMEVIIFAPAHSSIGNRDLPLPEACDDWIRLGNGFGWVDSVLAARGRYCAYLEENIRIDCEAFLSTFAKIINDSVSIAYLSAAHYFTEALDDAGNPLLDTSPQPVWTRATLLGRNRIQLSGFVHHRELLGNFKGNLTECGDMGGRALARYLASHYAFEVYEGACSYLIPGIRLGNFALPVFKGTLIDWYYDYGMTGLPSPDIWPQLSQAKLEAYALTLSDAWSNGQLFIHPGNENTLTELYLEKVRTPMRWPIFRSLLVSKRKFFLVSLWRKKRLFNVFAASLYTVYAILWNRCVALFRA